MTFAILHTKEAAMQSHFKSLGHSSLQVQ